MVFLSPAPTGNRKPQQQEQSMYEQLPINMGDTDMTDMDTSDSASAQGVRSDDWILAPIRLINTLTIDNNPKRGRKRTRQTKSESDSHASGAGAGSDEVPPKRLFEKPYTMLQNALTFASEELDSPGWILRPFRLLARTLIDKTQAPRKRGLLAMEAPQSNEGEIVPKKHLFQVELDVTGYDPQDLSVKTSADAILVSGRHEEAQMHAHSHGHASAQGNSVKQFTNTVQLPTNVIREQLECKLTSNGTKLIITAPLRDAEPTTEPCRTIPIGVS